MPATSAWLADGMTFFCLQRLQACQQRLAPPRRRPPTHPPLRRSSACSFCACSSSAFKSSGLSRSSASSRCSSDMPSKVCSVSAAGRLQGGGGVLQAGQSTRHALKGVQRAAAGGIAGRQGRAPGGVSITALPSVPTSCRQPRLPACACQLLRGSQPSCKCTQGEPSPAHPPTRSPAVAPPAAALRTATPTASCMRSRCRAASAAASSAASHCSASTWVRPVKQERKAMRARQRGSRAVQAGGEHSNPGAAHVPACPTQLQAQVQQTLGERLTLRSRRQPVPALPQRAPHVRQVRRLVGCGARGVVRLVVVHDKAGGQAGVGGGQEVDDHHCRGRGVITQCVWNVVMYGGRGLGPELVRFRGTLLRACRHASSRPARVVPTPQTNSGHCPPRVTHPAPPTRNVVLQPVLLDCQGQQAVRGLRSGHVARVVRRRLGVHCIPQAVAADQQAAAAGGQGHLADLRGATRRGCAWRRIMVEAHTGCSPPMHTAEMPSALRRRRPRQQQQQQQQQRFPGTPRVLQQQPPQPLHPQWCAPC